MLCFRCFIWIYADTFPQSGHLALTLIRQLCDGLLLFDLVFQVFRASLGCCLLTVEGVLLIDRVGEHDGTGRAIRHLHARGIVGVELAHEDDLGCTRLLLL